MFKYHQLQSMSVTDGKIARFVMANTEKVPYMTIRELAKETKWVMIAIVNSKEH